MDETEEDRRVRHMEAAATLWMLKRMALASGYRFEVNEDGNEERMYRPDGSLALTASRTEDAP